MFLSERNLRKSSNELNGNRLSPFKRIPQIGSSSNVNSNATNALCPHPPSSPSRSNPRRKYYSSRSNSNSNSSERIQLAIRLPNGKRIVEEFLSTDTIDDLRLFVETKENFLFGNIFYFSTGEIPKREFHQFNQTIQQAMIKDKTLLIVDRH